jgi:TolB protein
MNPRCTAFAASFLASALGCASHEPSPAVPLAPEPGERHFRNLRQLTFGGENAEAYWSADGERLILQSTRPPFDCDQIFTMRADGSDVRLVSTGKGRCTCSYFFPDGKRILFSSTHLASPDCPPKPDYSHGYVWAVYPGYDIFTANPDGSDLRRLTDNPDYDAESTFSTDGNWIVFTSVRDGDLDLYKMRSDGTQVTRLTNELGYDGGAFFSRDGSKIVYRAYHPTTPEAQARYRELLGTHLLEPRQLDLFVMNADGTGKRQITDNGAANFAPYFFPDGKRILFASNVHDPKGRNFDIYAIDVDGKNLEQITFNETFDGFPMFSPDGKRLVFASNRHDRIPGETNVFVTDWID